MVPPDCNITLFSINYVNFKAAEGFQVFQYLPVVVNRNSFYFCWEFLQFVHDARLLNSRPFQQIRASNDVYKFSFLSKDNSNMEQFTYLRRC